MNTWLWLNRLMLMLHLLTWSIFLLSSDQFPMPTLVFVSAAATATSSMAEQPQDIQDAVSATLVEWWRILLCTGKLCTETYFPRSRATINAFIIGMSESANYYLWSLQSLLQKCCRLRRNYAMAHTKLSTKTLYARYSDL